MLDGPALFPDRRGLPHPMLRVDGFYGYVCVFGDVELVLLYYNLEILFHQIVTNIVYKILLKNYLKKIFIVITHWLYIVIIKMVIVKKAT